MHPLLATLPSKALFAALLVAAAGILVRDVVRRRRDPRARLGTGPLHLVAAALLLLRLRGGSWWPAAEVLSRPWPPVPVHAYGTMLLASLVAGWFVTMRFAREDGVPRGDASAIFLWTAACSVVGARLLFVVMHPGLFDRVADVLSANRGGMVAYGGMIGGLLASVWQCRRRGVPLLRWADAAAPAVVLGTGITRIGCFLAGCDYGAPTGVAWAVRFPAGSSAWTEHVRTLQVPATAGASLPVHPTQLYEMAVGFALFGLLVLLRRHRRFSGQVFLGWVLGYGVLRPLIETVRGDPRERVGPLSSSQLIGLASVVLGLAFLALLLRRYREDPAGMRLWVQPAPAPPAARIARRRRRGHR